MSMHRITLDSRAQETDRLLDWLEPVLADSCLDDMAAFNLRCAIVELVNNSIVHAYGGRTGQPVDIRLELHSDRVAAEVRDLGPPFDGPGEDETADLLSESGRGFHIILAWVDGLSFSRSGDWNVCRIEKSASPSQLTL